MQIEITQQFVVYTGQTRLLELGTEIAASRSLTKPEILAKRQLATKIRLWLKALNDDYASLATRQKIWYALVDIGNLIDVPFAPVLTTNQPPTILVGIPGSKGDTGSTGATGGGVSFSSSNVGTDTVVDSFDTSLSTAAEWSYEVYNSSNKRVERLTGGWLSGVSTDDGGLATTDIGDTSGVTFSTNISGSTVQLIAHVSTGTWTIRGTRQLIPVSGNGITQPTSLTEGKIWIGDSANQPTAQTLSGDITVTDLGVTSISSGVVVNADINSSAAISVSKLAALTASKAVVTDSSGFLTTSTSAASKVDYLANVTSDIQTQINTIAAAGSITGAITTYVTTNATVSRAIVSNPSGKLTTALTTSTEIGYVNGVTSAIQTQIDSKQVSLGYTPVNKAGDTMSGALNSTSTAEFDLGIRTKASGSYFKIINLDIGTWNMSTTASINVAHGLSDVTKIGPIDVVIVSDLGGRTPLDRLDDATTGRISGSVTSIGSTNIVLTRYNSGIYNSVNYSSTGSSRGKMTIIYEA